MFNTRIDSNPASKQQQHDTVKKTKTSCTSRPRPRAFCARDADALEESSRPAAAAIHRIGQIHAPPRISTHMAPSAKPDPLPSNHGATSTALHPPSWAGTLSGRWILLATLGRTYHPAIRDNSSKRESGGSPVVPRRFFSLDRQH
ncbi:hypothetical protein PG997_003614 [Apiospora hydei]|uniref:Uncharacterized protein n=1 Tax=Apiospora hydei TaxID=1337664 RepID=A0ABR1WZS0_9PEZI